MPLAISAVPSRSGLAVAESWRSRRRPPPRELPRAPRTNVRQFRSPSVGTAIPQSSRRHWLARKNRETAPTRRPGAQQLLASAGWNRPADRAGIAPAPGTVPHTWPLSADQQIALRGRIGRLGLPVPPAGTSCPPNSRRAGTGPKYVRTDARLRRPGLARPAAKPIRTAPHPDVQSWGVVGSSGGARGRLPHCGPTFPAVARLPSSRAPRARCRHA